MEVEVDIPSAVTLEEINVLNSFAQNNYVLEIGSLLGFSTVHMARHASKVVSVDPHIGYPADNPRPTLDTFLKNLEKYEVRDKVEVVVAKFQHIHYFFKDAAFSMAFIDATGEYEQTLWLMRLAFQKIHQNGTLFVHDCGHPEWPGALDALKDYSKEKNLEYELVDRLGIIFKEEE